MKKKKQSTTIHLPDHQNQEWTAALDYRARHYHLDMTGMKSSYANVTAYLLSLVRKDFVKQGIMDDEGNFNKKLLVGYPKPNPKNPKV